MSTPTIPDYRMKFPAPTIDFAADVGLTGQDHDNYPAPNTQARFDWLRLVIISLLSHQASYDPPTQYREGTCWYNLRTETMMIWASGETGGKWTSVADAINVAPSETATLTLTQFYAEHVALQQKVDAIVSALGLNI